MMDQERLTVQFLPNFLTITQAHRQAGQQHDNLCGPYWTAVLLQSQGFTTTPEAIALLAGTVLPICDPVLCLPSGANSRQDYRQPLPTTTSLSQAGTSAQGLIHAVAKTTEQAYCLLPLRANWTAERIHAVLQLCQEQPAIPLCNICTGSLWGTSLPVSDAIAYLHGQPITPPASDWNVGHFLLLAGTITGSIHSLILICDTYPHFGWQGYHLQSADAIAQSLNRDDGYEGGILLFIASHHQTEVTQQATAIGCQISPWDNGSPIVDASIT